MQTDHYGPAEALAGRAFAADPALKARCQVLTKTCFFSPLEMAGLNKDAVAKAVGVSRQRLGLSPGEPVGMVQLYWGDYNIPRYVDAALYLMDLRAQGLITEVKGGGCGGW